MNLIKETYKEEFLNDSEEYAAETSVEHRHSPDYSSADGVNREPSVVPRLGDQYQVEIPALISQAERLQLQNTLLNKVEGIDFNFCVGRGLAIPVVWVHLLADHAGHVKDEILGTSSASDAVVQSGLFGFSPDLSNNNLTVPQDSKCKIERELIPEDDISMPLSQSEKMSGYVPLPGSPNTSWTDAESQIFLLGLYIFGKNLVQVQRFVESKDMGDVLSLYYGKFYRSDAQRRWVECRKTKGRRCILGHRIFTGWRQQELLSRLLPGRSKEFEDSLLEVTRNFNEGTATLEEFIFTLKSMIGSEALVEAIGIGKGKQDLTGIILDPVRTNPTVSARTEIPVGKACSSLTSGEIIKFLTGDFRLSKAKSNDLFWEAVWPRLLARGWHSEQPKDYLGSRNALVFLIPGIKKFSRKKLTKGNHYFDSVSDVLNKVASDPRHLVLEVEEGKDMSEVNDADTIAVQNGVSDNHRPCYLRPRLPDCNSDFMKFTVIDTSLAQGGAPSKMRELRSLPADASGSYRRNQQRETNSDGSADESSSSDSSSSSQCESDHRVRNNRRVTCTQGVQASLTNHLVTDQRLSSHENKHDLGGERCEILIDRPPVKDTKYHFSRRVKPGELNSLAPSPKRHRLASCRSAKRGSSSTSIPRCSQLKERDQPESLETSKGIAAGDRTSPEESNAAVLSQEKSQPRTLIDLNLQPQDVDSEGRMDMEVEGSQDNMKPNESLEARRALDDSMDIVSPEDQQAMMNSRRHSTRNRPPTAKALEALACGYLTVRKERGTRAPRSGNLTTRSRRARKNVEASLPPSVVNPDVVAPSIGINEDYCRTTNHAIFFDSSSHVRAEREEAHELLGVL